MPGAALQSAPAGCFQGGGRQDTRIKQARHHCLLAAIRLNYPIEIIH
jgi:hypothetical protein